MSVGKPYVAVMLGQPGRPAGNQPAQIQYPRARPKYARFQNTGSIPIAHYRNIARLAERELPVSGVKNAITV